MDFAQTLYFLDRHAAFDKGLFQGSHLDGIGAFDEVMEFPLDFRWLCAFGKAIYYGFESGCPLRIYTQMFAHIPILPGLQMQL
jgi:hypothetical protein